jgi:hypothetical protein
VELRPTQASVAGIEFPQFATVILPTDRDFDLFVREAQEESMFVVIDPIFDANSNPVGGFIIGNFNEIVARATIADDDPDMALGEDDPGAAGDH